jgi:hypothetical protein
MATLASSSSSHQHQHQQRPHPRHHRSRSVDVPHGTATHRARRHRAQQLRAARGNGRQHHRKDKNTNNGTATARSSNDLLHDHGYIVGGEYATPMFARFLSGVEPPSTRRARQRIRDGLDLHSNDESGNGNGNGNDDIGNKAKKGDNDGKYDDITEVSKPSLSHAHTRTSVTSKRRVSRTRTNVSSSSPLISSSPSTTHDQRERRARLSSWRNQQLFKNEQSSRPIALDAATTTRSTSSSSLPLPLPVDVTGESIISSSIGASTSIGSDPSESMSRSPPTPPNHASLSSPQVPSIHDSQSTGVGVSSSFRHRPRPPSATIARTRPSKLSTSTPTTKSAHVIPPSAWKVIPSLYIHMDIHMMIAVLTFVRWDDGCIRYRMMIMMV